MPIDLTVSDGSGYHRSRRRSRSRHRAQRQLFFAIAAGLGVLLLLGGGLYYSNPRKVDPSTTQGRPNLDMPDDPIPVEKGAAPANATSAEATSSDSQPAKHRLADIISVRRVRGGDETALQIKYEFLRGAASPDSYLIAVQTPEGKGYSSFAKEAAKTDTVQISLQNKRLSGRGPITVWIESSFGNERVSNIMTLP